MIRASKGRGLSPKLIKHKYNYALSSNGVVGRKNWASSSRINFYETWDRNSNTWIQTKPLLLMRKNLYRGKTYSVIFATMDTPEEAIAVAEAVFGAKPGTKDFRLKLALVCDELITIPESIF